MNKEQEDLEVQTQKFQDLLQKISTCCQKRQDYEAGHFELPYAEAQCLLAIASLEPVPLKKLTKTLDISKGRVTRLVQGLINKDLVSYTSDPKDARLKKCFVTKRGKEQIEKILHFRHELHKKILLQISPQARQQLLVSLQNLQEIMDKVRKELREGQA